MKTEILKTKNRLDVSIEGRLDAVTSPELEEKLMPALDGIKTLVFDLAKLSVISSAGLRVLLSALKVMDSSGGTLTIKNASEDVRKVFRLTGFLEILNVQ
ncbi:anti-sigma B factor antagonist [Ruminococcaceae bacterium FB2012]|nr:anti-sigma B factor antagonist [Ruminococcaceae bacterium FB2012]